MLQRFFSALRRLKRETLTLYYAARDRRTPWYAKLVVGLIVAYALSPIDLVPDFIPILGYVDEIILLPIAIWFALRLLPAPVVVDARAQATTLTAKKQRVVWGAFLVIAIWIALATGCGLLLYESFNE
ncbi:MAG TPA: YkvA family protein [Burkholderiales bacterium]|nr:YkvA family protein [Burkholderiales bacterium]